MTDIKIGVTLHPQHTTTAEYMRAWQQADAIGAEYIWNWDHPSPIWSPERTCMRAGRLRHARPDTPGGDRQPRALDELPQSGTPFSDGAYPRQPGGGRLILGLGAGWFERDYIEYGYEFGTPVETTTQPQRGIEVIKARWARDEPKPIRGTVPLLIGGGGEKVTLLTPRPACRSLARFGSPIEWGRKNRILDDWCTKVGRSPAAIERSAFIADEFSQTPIKEMRPHYDTLEYVAAGANHIYYGLGAPFDARLKRCCSGGISGAATHKSLHHMLDPPGYIPMH